MISIDADMNLHMKKPSPSSNMFKHVQTLSFSSVLSRVIALRMIFLIGQAKGFEEPALDKLLGPRTPHEPGGKKSDDWTDSLSVSKCQFVSEIWGRFQVDLRKCFYRGFRSEAWFDSSLTAVDKGLNDWITKLWFQLPFE